MRAGVIRNICFREIRDQLRDRRTVFMLMVFPLLLYPGLGMAMSYMTVLFAEKPITIGIAGAEYLEVETIPATSAPGPVPRAKLPPLIEQGRFAEDLVTRTALSTALRVQTCTPEELEEKLKRGEIQAYLVFTSEMAEALRSGKQVRLEMHLSGSEPVPLEPADSTSISRQPVLSVDDEKAQLTFDRLRPILSAWREKIVEARMKALHAPDEQYAVPFMLPRLRAKQEWAWGKIFPFLIVMMSLTGALYPAIDVCAGEKERGTMETLLISPASRAEIVTGKFLTVWLFSTATALLNLSSLGFSAWQFGRAGGLLSGGGSILPIPSAQALFWGVVLLVPLAAFFSAICLALAVYARSTKEGQYYLMPLTVLTMVLTFASLLPGMELTPAYSMVPITGAALLLQQLMNARAPDEVPWQYLAPVLIPLMAYCYLALHWAIHQFNSESVLFREAERLDLGLWLKRLLREKEQLPSAGEALACFAILMFVRWVLSTSGIRGGLLVQTAILQLAGVALPALLMAVLLTSRPLQSLRICWPRWPGAVGGPGRALAGGIAWLMLAGVLALALHGPLLALLHAIVEQFPQIKEHLEELGKLIDLPESLGLQLLVLAAAPAVCEELAFRGFILSGLASRMGIGRGILVSSLLFAFAHLDAFRFIPTFALGLVLGLLATRSGSIWPGMLFHGIHNGLAVTAGVLAKRYSQANEEPPWIFNDQGLYGWPMIVVGTAVAIVALITLTFVRSPRTSAEAAEAST